MSKRKPATNRGLPASPMFVVAAVVLIAAAIGLAAFWLFVWSSDEPNRADAANPTLVARGEVLYQQHCASCHGANLEGQPNWRERDADGMLPAPPHDVTGHTWHHSDALLFDVTKLGSTAVVGSDYMSNMPGFARPSATVTFGQYSHISKAPGPRISRRSSPIWRTPETSEGQSVGSTSLLLTTITGRAKEIPVSLHLLPAQGKYFACKPLCTEDRLSPVRRGTACRAPTHSKLQCKSCVAPAESQDSRDALKRRWIPAFAGMTARGFSSSHDGDWTVSPVT